MGGLYLYVCVLGHALYCYARVDRIGATELGPTEFASAEHKNKSVIYQWLSGAAWALGYRMGYHRGRGYDVTSYRYV